MPAHSDSSPDPLRILMCNFRLAEHTISEVFTRDVASMLHRSGHQVAIYTSQKGDLAEEVEAQGIPVLDQPGQLSFTPDIIHGQFNLETICALLHYPQAPAIYLTHGSHQWRERPPKFPRIFRYLAKSADAAQWVAEVVNQAPEEVPVLPEFIDLGELPASLPVRKRPLRALVYDAVPALEFKVGQIRQACKHLEIEVVQYSHLIGQGSIHLPTLLPEFDLVFASGYAATQALALGCGVICFESTQIGEMVTTENFTSLFADQFPAHETGRSPEEEIRQWQTRLLSPLAGWIREALSTDNYRRQLESYYREAISRHQGTLIAPQEELAAVADWLIELADNHHAVDRGFLKVQDQLLQIHRDQEQARQDQADLEYRLELEKRKVRTARQLLSESGFLGQGLQRKIEDAWREIEQGIPDRSEVGLPEDVELPR